MEDRQTPSVSSEELLELQERLGIHLSDVELLRQAVTHRSYLGEVSGFESNERLEFLGDSILGVVISEYLYRLLDDRPEGDLSKAKAVAVSEPVLAEAARALDIQKSMLLSTGEHLSGGRERDSILSDMYEAIVGVIYLDRGLEAAREFILRSLQAVLKQVEEGSHLRDYKSQLQMITQSRRKITPRYRVTNEAGADHDKTFTIEVEVEGRILGRGVGKSKKQAEQAAAEQALGLGLFMDEEDD